MHPLRDAVTRLDVCIKQTCCEHLFDYDLSIKVYPANCVYLPFVVRIFGLI